VILGIRPEDLEDAAFAPGEGAERTISTICGLRETLGSEVLVHFAVGGPAARSADASEFIEPLDEDTTSIFVARIDPQTTAREGAPLSLVVDTRRLHFFDPESGKAIYGEGHDEPRFADEPAAALHLS
jgi:multiple sugar transport system ATP-binding protein